MALFKNKKYRSKRWFSRTILSLGVAVFYGGLVSAAIYIVVFSSGHIQKGQLIPGETVSDIGFSRSLDLKIAAKNTYPSAPLLIVQNLGIANGIDQKVISFKVAADSLTEYGLMMLPAGQAPSHGWPTLLWLHGYENPQQYSTLADGLEDMVFYAQHGFAVIKPDYRGQGFSANAGVANSAYYSMAYNTDIMSLITAVKKTNYLDKDNISIWGHSMGAYIGLRAAALSPDIKNLILLSGPVASLKTMYLTYIPSSDVNNLNALKTRNQVFAKYGNPAQNSSFWNSASPINFVSKIKAHVQIHVGSLDQIVPPEFSADLDKALTKDHIVHDYYVYPDGVHSLAAQRGLIWPRTLQILKPSLPSPAA